MLADLSPTDSAPPGGLGGVPRHQVEDRVLGVRAIRLGWPMSDAVRRRAIAILVVDLKSPKIRDRHRAIKLLATLNAQNLADLHHQEGSRSLIEQVDNRSPIERAADMAEQLQRLGMLPEPAPAPALPSPLPIIVVDVTPSPSEQATAGPTPQPGEQPKP